MNNRFGICSGLIVSLLCISGTIITRHDVDDALFVELGKKYEPYLAHFPMGEGTMIAEQWVLTAGHVGADLLHDMEIGYSPTAIVNGVEYAIDRVEVHPSFEPIVNDLALVHLKEPVTGSALAGLYRDSLETGKMVIVAGRGDKGTGLTGPQEWDKKTRAATNQVDRADAFWISFSFDEPASEKCTPMEGISGPGDSGGPAFFEIDGRLYLAGISSHQKGNGQKGRYGVTEFYTRVSRYSSWIDQILSA